MKWNLESIRKELADNLETEALDAIACGQWGRDETMDQLLVVDCLRNNWTVKDFFLKFKNSDVIDPWKIKNQVECMITTKQVEEMFEIYGEDYAKDY